MNKILKYILTVFLILIIGSKPVFAYQDLYSNKPYSEKYNPECVNEGTCEVVCRYVNNFCHFKDDHSSYVDQYNAAIFYNKTKKKYYAIWQIKSSNKTYTSKNLNDSVYISSEDKANLANGICPQKGFVDRSTFILSSSEVCFGTKEYCEKKSGIGTKFIEDEGKIKCTEKNEDGTVATTGTELTEDNADKVATDNNIGAIDITDNSSFKSCQDILGANVYKILQKFFKMIYVIVPFLVLVLGMLDLGKAVLSSKEDEIRQAKKRFTKRIAMGLLVFIVPTIINILFYVVNFAKDPSDSNNFFNYVRGDICIDD